MSILDPNRAKHDALRETLQEALRAMGFPCKVEARDKLAILTPQPDADSGALADAELRARAVALVREHGFTHVALEIPTTVHGKSAPLPGD